MKVILLAPTPPPIGGIAGWTVRMQNANLKNGWEVEVVDEKLIKGREVFGKRTKRNLLVEIKRSCNIWKNLLRALKDKKSKVVHASIPASTTGMAREIICALLTKLKRRKFIIHYRCTLPNMVTSRTGLLMFKVLTFLSDRVIVLNTPSYRFVKKHSQTKTEIIPNFIEEKYIIPKNTKEIKNKIETVVYVGGVIKSKGCNEIIKIATKFPDVQFRLIGNPDSNIIKQKIPKNCILLGERNKNEIIEELKKADLFMFLTYFKGEGFSNALVEAMANGLPCIVTDWAANKDMIENKGGIVVPIKNTNAIEKALKYLNENKELRRQQSNWNIMKVKKCYMEKHITDMYVDLYEASL